VFTNFQHIITNITTENLNREHLQQLIDGEGMKNLIISPSPTQRHSYRKEFVQLVKPLNIRHKNGHFLQRLLDLPVLPQDPLGTW